MERYAAIIGWGIGLPRRVVSNHELEQTVHTSDAWIRTRTGIAARRLAAPDEYTSVLATAAGQQALAQAAIASTAIDLVILATSTPDRPFPATACTVQANLGLSHAGAFDLVAACSGFVYGLSVATSLIRSGAHQTILLIAADLFSHLLDWRDRSTAVLFGDGAGAVVLQARPARCGLLASALHADGTREDLMAIEAGGTRLPLTPALLDDPRRHFAMHGSEIFRVAVREMQTSAEQVLAAAGLRSADIHLVIPHQANARIIETLARRLNVPPERVFVNLAHYGNTSAASVPIALYEAVEQGRVQPGDYLLLTSFGGGLTWASAVVRWGS